MSSEDDIAFDGEDDASSHSEKVTEGKTGKRSRKQKRINQREAAGADKRKKSRRLLL